ncbi:MAG: metallophosphoesterase [Armatimonadota bacterium]|nr:metallophosphoesterase [Armatimonadota bacterium]MDW8155520.1 metallophosphoesterase [Armatimonadota bacterium]
MRIYATADLHGRPDRIQAVREAVHRLHPEVVILAGDLTHSGRGREALELLELADALVLAIPGNMDPFDVDEAIVRSRARNPHRGVVDYRGVRFGGLGEEPTDVLVVHEPPRGVLDRAWNGAHIGSGAVRDYVERHRPRVVVCGHVHESPGIARLGPTTVVNCTMGNDRYVGALITWQLPEPAVELLPRPSPQSPGREGAGV